MSISCSTPRCQRFRCWPVTPANVQLQSYTLPKSSNQLDARYARLTAVALGYLPADRVAVDAWHAQLGEALEARTPSADRTPAVAAFAELIDTDGIVRMYVRQMIAQAREIRHAPGKPDVVDDIRGLLDALDYIVTLAPPFALPPAPSQAFPLSNLFVYMMMTRAGEAAFRLERFNDALRAILKEWCGFLDSEASALVLNDGPDGWLSEPAYQLYKLEEFVIPDRAKPHWGWPSYNAFFHREIKPTARPVSDPDDPKVIVSANDGTVSTIARGVKRSDEFWLKGEPYSLINMLNGDEAYVEQFVGGDVFQSFLSGANYHRWHSPIDGVVRKLELVEALMFSDLEAAGYDIGAATKCLAYEASVNTRGLVYVESDDPTIGTVCVIPIGITEISSVRFSVEENDTVKKGQELGSFSYGGSTLALVFQPGAVARFTVEAPEYPNPPTIAVNAQIAIAN
jgi:phosphatidylserine decarboxylase